MICKVNNYAISGRLYHDSYKMMICYGDKELRFYNKNNKNKVNNRTYYKCRMNRDKELRRKNNKIFIIILVRLIRL